MAEGFAALHEQELSDLGRDPGAAPEYATGGGGTERYVRVTPHDLIGLCLSGGGVRSATFNLGVLQALSRLGVLERFDYLSTVSGGGYIGSWWMRMRQRRGAEFPDDRPDAPEVRHLREFSNFLSPRVGISKTETWNFAVALVSAMVPSLAAAAAALLLVLWAASQIAARLRLPQPSGADVLTLAFAGLTVAVIAAGELAWRRRRRAAEDDRGGVILVVSAVIGVAAAALTWRALEGRSWAAVAGWAAGFGVLVVLRFAASRLVVTQSDRAQRSALDRVAGRLLWLAMAAAVFGVVWRLGGWLVQQTGQFTSWTVPGGATVGAIALWVVKRVTAEPSRARTGGFVEKLRAYLPQVIAWAVIVLAAAAVAAFLQSGVVPPSQWWAPGAGALGVLLLVALLFDPAEVGLHSAYRTRIARTFLGDARNDDTARVSDETEKDDVPLWKSGEREGNGAEQTLRPIHLVCCAANDLAGDQLPILGRGAHSGVLSRHGFSVGDAYRPWRRTDDETTLAGAVTASAAAFNPAMGLTSTKLGVGVTFLVAALDLRLGLWLPHPADGSTLPAWLPGNWFLREMMSRLVVTRGRGVHLSDGGHFENLALYELVRRHCRYIVVSDCGQDLDMAFDDVGNAIRRVRADFGVEITLDFEALRPDANGLSRRHVAVGDITYPDGDRGVIVVIKPTVTGDEPNDVLQYRSRNSDFPHETTTDQFYDAAQWESYRRLGVHIAEDAFTASVRRGAGGGAIDFGTMRQEWYPTPPGMEEADHSLDQCSREIADALRKEGPAALARQVYPEIAWGAETDILASHEWPQAVEVVVRVTQLMEDVWRTSSLERYPGHPANVAWMNWFQRWASTPTFRTLWPILRPMWSAQMRRFFEPRFDLDALVDLDVVGEIVRTEAGGVPGLGTARMLWERRRATPPQGNWFELWLRLEGGAPERRVQIALARLYGSTDPQTLVISDPDLYVVPGFWGAGIGTWFLNAIVERIRRDDTEVRRIEVVFAEAPPTDAAARQTRADQEQFYARNGFRAETVAGRRVLALTLAPTAPPAPPPAP
jgi:GNAT superfamily N-acetyltransferase